MKRETGEMASIICASQTVAVDYRKHQWMCAFTQRNATQHDKASSNILEPMSYSKGRFTLDEIEFIQVATVRVLVAVSKGELDLNNLARDELASRGLDQNGIWVGFERARHQRLEARGMLDSEDS